MCEVFTPMIHNRKLSSCLALLCIFCTMLTLCCHAGGLIPSAAAEEKAELLRISLSAQPEELVEPSEVTLTLLIENTSALDAQNVYLSSSDGLLSEPIGQISAGDKQTLSRPHSVSQAELDAGFISYIISHDDPHTEGNKVNYTVSAAIHQSDLHPEAEFTRQFSTRYVPAGGSVTITYRIRNTGNVALSSLLVQDALGDFTGRIDRLEAGESRALVSRVSLNETTSSTATLSYDVEALENQSFVTALSEAPVRIAYGQIDAELSAGYSAFSTNTADVVLLLTNLGNVDYSDIRITDDIYGGVIADNMVLPSGVADPVEVSGTYPVRGDAGFRWRITGVSEAGERIDFVTQTVTLEPKEVFYPAEVTLQAQALTPKIRRAGNVPVLIRIENPGDADVTALTLSEASLGELRSFAIIPAGGAIERSVLLSVKEDSQFSFSLRYTDGSGRERDIAAQPVSVEIAADGVTPEGAAQPFIDFSGNSIKIGGSSIFAVLLIVGCAVLLVLIIVLLVVSHRARMEKQLRIAAEKQRRKKEEASRSAAPGKAGVRAGSPAKKPEKKGKKA